MRILNEIPEDRSFFQNPILTIGNFDGVHLGHRRIFSMLLNIAKKKAGDPIVMTFKTHPKKILFPDTPPKILTTEREKINAIANCGIENIIVLDFTREIADMHAMEFIDELIFKRIGLIDIVVGYDHTFGKDREGNIDFLRELSRAKGFGVTKIEAKDFHSKIISSTWIRAEIEYGNIELANTILGRRYSLAGKVVKGAGRGRILEFPTANIVPDDSDKIIPKDGVYAVSVVIDKSITRYGMLNIGTNPTFANAERTIEVNIFNFDGEIYGEDIELEFYNRIRDEIRFGSSEDLVKQLNRDKITVQGIFK